MISIIDISRIIGAFLLFLSGVHLFQNGEYVLSAVDVAVGAWLLWGSIETIDPTGV